MIVPPGQCCPSPGDLHDEMPRKSLEPPQLAHRRSGRRPGSDAADFLQMRSPRRPEALRLSRRQGPERHSYLSCRAAWPTRNRSIPSPTPRSNTAASWARSRRTRARCSARRCRSWRRVADKIAVIRSMTHGEAAHERGTHNMFTGYRPSPALNFPSMGSVVSHEYGPRQQPAAVCLHSERAERIRQQRLPQLVVRPVQPGRRSGEPGLQGAGPVAARRRR